ncbi:MAG TPA: hypothetical protein VEW46_20135, partial [Pyrinomonadaceae bacterium]|nr:hypothetical protein [Pyrinomonadaceae bacterium]
MSAELPSELSLSGAHVRVTFLSSGGRLFTAGSWLGQLANQAFRRAHGKILLDYFPRESALDVDLICSQKGARMSGRQSP